MPGLTDAAQWRLSFRAAGVQQKKERKKPKRQRARNSSHFQPPSRDRETDHGDRNTGLHRPDQPIFRNSLAAECQLMWPALIRAFSAFPAYHRCVIAHPTRWTKSTWALGSTLRAATSEFQPIISTLLGHRKSILWRASRKPPAPRYRECPLVNLGTSTPHRRRPCAN